MGSESLLHALAAVLTDWLRLSSRDMSFPAIRTTLFLLAMLAGTSALLLLSRPLWRRGRELSLVTLPTLLPTMRQGRLSWLRHVPFALFLAGVPFFALAIADPHTSLRREEATYKGRRIALVIDSSTSMIMRFENKTLRPRSGPAFFTAVAASERFVRRRMAQPYHDLFSLIQFGDQAYVVTPFTTDYENILLSLHLIGTPAEWGHFPEWGTTILQGMEVGTSLFKMFGFEGSAGNLMIVLSDGRDEQIRLKRETLDTLMDDARQSRIPIYMIRIAQGTAFGGVRQDLVWKPAVERTGGRFYAAHDEAAILQALGEIDRLSAGTISVHQYTSQRPQFAGYAFLAVVLWMTAAALKASVPHFRTFQ